MNPALAESDEKASREKASREFSVQMLRQEAADEAKQGNYAQAISLLTQVIQSSLSGRTAMDYNNRGLMYFHCGQLEEAIADYNRALELNPNLAAAYNNRANCYVNQGELIYALVDYDRALDLNPFHLRALINQGVTFRHLGMYREALDNFDIALAQGKLFAYIYAQRGRTHHLAGDWNWAIADYLRSLQYLNQEKNALGSPNSGIGKFVNTWLKAILAPLTA
jgi:tetratricopeptide (TPR) repeat protein